jgi:hypothetical protein
MNSCDFIPILLFRRTWPEMGKDVSHLPKGDKGPLTMAVLAQQS